MRKYFFLFDEKKLKENFIRCFLKEKDVIESFFKFLRVGVFLLENEINLNELFIFVIIILVVFLGLDYI